MRIDDQGPIDILVIPDAHIRSGDRLDRIRALGRLILARRPDVIVCLGDWWDMPSLASHREASPLGTGDQPTKREGLRVVADIMAGAEAIDALLQEVSQLNKKHRATAHHHRQYRPRLVMLEGNHEERLRRISRLHPELRGFIDDQAIEGACIDRGWEWHPFLRPVEIAGITFSHYFETPGTGRPMQIAAWPAKIPFSAVWGHTHQLHHRLASLPFGRSIAGLCAGSFRADPPAHAAHEWSGVLMLRGAEAGAYDLEQISTDRLLREFGPSRAAA